MVPQNQANAQGPVIVVHPVQVKNPIRKQPQIDQAVQQAIVNVTISMNVILNNLNTSTKQDIEELIKLMNVSINSEDANNAPNQQAIRRSLSLAIRAITNSIQGSQNFERRGHNVRGIRETITAIANRLNGNLTIQDSQNAMQQLQAQVALLP